MSRLDITCVSRLRHHTKQISHRKNDIQEIFPHCGKSVNVACSSMMHGCNRYLITHTHTYIYVRNHTCNTIGECTTFPHQINLVRNIQKTPILDGRPWTNSMCRDCYTNSRSRLEYTPIMLEYSVNINTNRNMPYDEDMCVCVREI